MDLIVDIPIFSSFLLPIRYDQGERSQRHRPGQHGTERRDPHHRFSFGSLLIEGPAEPPLVITRKKLDRQNKTHITHTHTQHDNNLTHK